MDGRDKHGHDEMWFKLSSLSDVRGMSMLPETMTVIEAKGSGGPEVLVPGTRPLPQPGPGELLIEVAAAGINRPDVLQRQGLYPAPKGASDILGMEIAGTVVAVGSDVARFKLGDRRLRAGRRRRLCRVLRGARRRPPSPSRQASAWSRPRHCPRPCSPSGTMCSSAPRSSPANGCWCMAARAASAPPRSRSAPRSAPR